MTGAPIAAQPRHVAVAFAGGALFVLSLLYGAVAYVRNFGAPAEVLEGHTFRSITIDVLLFTAFAAHHSVFARTRAKTWISRLIPQPLERTTYVVIASALFVLVCASWQPVPGSLWRVDGPAALGLTTLQIMGVIAAIGSSRRLDVLSLAGIRQAREEPAQAPGVISDGWYGIVRHPIYLGWILMVWPSPHLSATRALFAAISTTYLLLAIPIEERALRRDVGPGYDAYAKRTRWRIVPYVY
jgi:protein-S-isoprenylcysteine O-methyltransferase Ste14